MKQGTGLPVFAGIAMGPVVVYRRAEAARAGAVTASVGMDLDAVLEEAHQAVVLPKL